MLAAHCAGSLRSLTVINSSASRWDTEENANKTVCVKERELPAGVGISSRGRAAFHAMMDLFSDLGF